MVSACAQEERARVAPHHAIEAERFGEEHGALVDVADVQVHVTHHGSGRHTDPRCVARGAHEFLNVHRVGGHHQFAIHPPPGLARPVGVDLDAEPIGVLQVERLAHEMVARAGVDADGTEMPDEAAERRAIREEDREVIEPETRPRCDGPDAGDLIQLDQYPVAACYAQRRA